MVSLGKRVRSGAIASKPGRRPERRIRRRAGCRVFSPCEQDDRCAKRRRAFSEPALVVGVIKFLTVRNLITRWGRRSYVDVSVNSLQCGPTDGRYAEGRGLVPEGQRENSPAFERRECDCGRVESRRDG